MSDARMTLIDFNYLDGEGEREVKDAYWVSTGLST